MQVNPRFVFVVVECVVEGGEHAVGDEHFVLVRLCFRVYLVGVAHHDRLAVVLLDLVLIAQLIDADHLPIVPFPYKLRVYKDDGCHLRPVSNPMVDSLLQSCLGILPFISLFLFFFEKCFHVFSPGHFGDERLLWVGAAPSSGWLLVSKLDAVQVIQERAVHSICWLGVALGRLTRATSWPAVTKDIKCVALGWLM